VGRKGGREDDERCERRVDGGREGKGKEGRRMVKRNFKEENCDKRERKEGRDWGKEGHMNW
jgi:hypothetical protein